ncbi:hypothetical protein DH2020_019581 [Rehmannia glutinosa]|uniref:Glycosyltransferase 61 catalytic domain-containing protein n=1 Tax=Rehmannia glutinosa TaxID=99300 RepID=A0ABR0WR64_REHGL
MRRYVEGDEHVGEGVEGVSGVPSGGENDGWNGSHGDQNVKPIISTSFSNSRSDVLQMNGDIRIHGNSSTIFVAASTLESDDDVVRSWTLKPYARKGDVFVMHYVRKWKIKYEAISKLPKCDRNISVPAVVFSTEFGIHPWEFPYYTMEDFRQFLRSTYSLNRKTVTILNRPRMLIVSRKNSRRLKNENEVVEMAQSLGFDVIVREIVHNMSIVAKFVNSFDVMMGVHGAGLTNMVFLPNKAIVIEIIPFGLELLAKDYFKLPAKEMKLSYLEYKVGLNESSLLGKYPLDSEVYRNPGALQKKGFLGFRSIYLDNQDVNLDCGRFRETLLNALEIIENN